MKKRWLCLIFFITLFFLFFYYDFHHLMSLEFVKSQQVFLQELYRDHPVQMIVAFSALYIVTTALSLPTVIFLSVLGGAIFGLTVGTIIVSFTSTIGATVAFLISRWIFHDAVHRRFHHYLQKFNKGIENHGSFYLFTLRTTPVVPYSIVNLVMGLTSIRTSRFYIVSQIGMLPSKFIYVNAGTQLATVESFSDILSFKVILSLLLLALIPLALRLIMSYFQRSASIG